MAIQSPLSKMSSKATHAGLQEIFSSIQGEGPHIGKRQIFVRFNVCHLKCAYCDTPPLPSEDPCLVEAVSGSDQKIAIENPVSADDVFFWIRHFVENYHNHSVSFTGGEPLLYTAFLKNLLPQVQPLIPVYLETSGTQPDKLAEILEWVDIIAMDIKLPSATGEPMQLENHQVFYQMSRQKDHFVKAVFSNETSVEEMLSLRDIVTNPACPIILQPMTSLETGKTAVLGQKIFELETALSKHFSDVRVIPQTHKYLSLL